MGEQRRIPVRAEDVWTFTERNVPLAGFTHMVPDPLVTTRLNQRIEQFLERNVARAGAEGSTARAVARP